MTDAIPVFDGHNDLLLRLATKKTHSVADRFSGQIKEGHIDLPRARAGGLAGGLFAAFSPPLRMPPFEPGPDGGYDTPLPERLALEAAQATTFAQFSVLLRLVRTLPEDLALCRTVPDIRAAMAAGRLATVLHIEGAEAIDPDLVALDVLHAAGLRSLGLVWSRSNVFANGVPFRFPSTPDIGDGLTEAGRELVHVCNARGILIDLSHLNEKGFWDVAGLTTAPLVATHSNVHALCPSSRNLTERQLATIRDSRGVVGLNFATCFLRPDGAMRADTDMDLMVRHLDALVEALGEDGVALGSDFDGAVIPAELADAAGLPRLIERLRKAGYGETLIRKVAMENWLSVLERTWG